MELVVRPSSGTDVEFVGHSYIGEAVAAQLCTYAFGVLDKETKTLKIMPIAGNKIFRLCPKVQRPDNAEEPASVENGKGDKRERTTNSFSTKKAKNQEMKARALKQGDNPLSEKLLEEQLERAAVNKEALESTTSTQVARNIPPHNASADTPQAAYPLDGIIQTVEWDYLGDIYRTLEKGVEIAQDAYPHFVWNRIHKLHTAQDDEKKQTLAGVLSYISHLVKYNDRFSSNGRSASKKHRIPDTLFQKFLGMFNPDSTWLPDVKRDLLISYVLVLTLYIDDFQTDPADIAKDLKMNPIDLKTHFQNLGCKVAKERWKSAFSVTLPVPLQFPVLRVKRRRY